MNTTAVSEAQAVQPVVEQADNKAAPSAAPHPEQQAARQARAVLDQAQAAVQAGESDTAEAGASALAAELRFIGLSRLRLTRRDLRKTRAPVDALAESTIRVRLLHNLIVVSVAGEDGQYEVVAGGRRCVCLPKGSASRATNPFPNVG